MAELNKTFIEKLEVHWQQKHFVCVGLDSSFSQIPQKLKKSGTVEEIIVRFNQAIIEATSNLVCAYKPNMAFYEAEGVEGLRALERTIKYIKENYPEIPVILDAKRADIGNTNEGYLQAAFDILKADAITVHPYLGKEALKPFLERKDKGIIVLVKTSNPGAGEFQDLKIGPVQEPLYEVVARNVAQNWNQNGNCAVVVGATYPSELAKVRAIVENMPILIPGIGAQGGDIKATVEAAKNKESARMIINSSREIIFASKNEDFAEAAHRATEQLTREINNYI